MTQLPVALDLAALETVDPNPPAFIVDGWLPAGETALFAGHGGTGKSFQALHLAACIALGRHWQGINTHRRRVAYFSFEDGVSVLHWRLTRICRHLGIGLSDLAGWLTIYDGTRSNAVLFGDGQSGIETTETYEWMRTSIKEIASQCVIIDGVSDTYASNENARANVKAFVRAIRNLIPADGAAILIAHVDKGSANSPNTSQGYSGSTGWNNSVRSRWYLRPEISDAEDSTLIDGRVVLELQKSNYGPTGATIPLRWDSEAHMHVRDEGAPPATGIESDLRDAVLRLIEKCAQSGNHVPAARVGPRTAAMVLDAAGLPAQLSGRRGRRQLYRLIEQMRQAGLVQVESIKGGDRHLRDYLVPAAAMRECISDEDSRARATPARGCGSYTGVLGDSRTPAADAGVQIAPNSKSVAPSHYDDAMTPPAKLKKQPKPRKSAVRSVVGDPALGGRRLTAVPSA